MPDSRCISCRKRPPEPQRLRCRLCLDASKAVTARYRLKHPQRVKARERRRYRRLKAAKRCTGCLKRPAAEGKTRCQPCLDEKKTATQAKRAHRRAHHLCHTCGHPTEGKSHCAACLQRIAAHHRAVREEVLHAYGNACACCGETEPCFLHIDHMDNDGYTERKTFGRSSLNLYRWLKRHSFPKDRYQLLCANCNFGRFLNGGICPHQQRKEPQAVIA
jgi:hypothetical protein